MTPFKFILKYVSKIKIYVIMTYLLFGLSSVFKTSADYFIASLFGFIAEHPKEIVSYASMSFIAIYASLHFGTNIIDGIRTVFEYRMEVLLKHNILTDLFRHTHAHSANYFATEMSGSISQRVFNTWESILSLTWHGKGVLEGLVVPLSVGLTVLFRIDIYLGFSIMTLFIVASTINYYHTKNLKPIAKTQTSLCTIVTGIATDSIANARLVKNCAATKHEQNYLLKALHKWIRYNLKSAKETGISNCYNQLSVMVVRVMALSIVIYYWYVKSFSITDILLAITYVNTVISPIELFGTHLIEMQQNIGKLEDSLKTLFKPFDIIEAPNAKKLIIKKSDIVFDNVSFAYTKEKRIFENFNLEIKAGEKVGIVGLSGAGKSTLINLILRAYDVDSGAVTISSQNIKEVTLHSLRKNIAIISQDPSLFNRSIKENIAFAKPKATNDDIIEAAKSAYIHDIILAMPQGYDSTIGERGVKLSGGERQRIAIASAILKNTPILILDEATSALDSQSEEAIQKALINIMKDKTVIAIAHRLSTLNNMDRIIVLDNGKIIEDGTPQALLKNKKGTFFKFYSLQTNGLINQLDTK